MAMRVSRVPLLRAAHRRVAISSSSSSRSLWALQRQCRVFSSEPSQTAPQSSSTTTETHFDVFKNCLNTFFLRDARVGVRVDDTVTLQGFLGKRRDKGGLSFCDLTLDSRERFTVQIVSSKTNESAHLAFKSIPAYSPVLVTGVVTARQGAEEISEATIERDRVIYLWDSEVKLETIQCLNPFPNDIIVSKDAVWPPQSRHLQMRFDDSLYHRLHFRSDAASHFRRRLFQRRFIEVETPVLFKSTPEGAREFLVPTRRKGFAYALPQSPQQYKQILMAGGVSRYFQFAKCFRDEDHRADRQPEFTQLDLEMAFTSGRDMMRITRVLIESLCEFLVEKFKSKRSPQIPPIKWSIERKPMSYAKAMHRFGIDKPDLRIQSSFASDIVPVGHWLSAEFEKMITSLDKPIVEALKFRLGGSPQQSAEFTKKLFDMLPNTTHRLGGDSTPGVFVVDSSKPLRGLSAIGHEGAEKLLEYEGETLVGDWKRAEDGDVIIIHARKDQPFHGGSTELGRLRKLIYDTAVEQGFVAQDASEMKFCYINEFPLFSPSEGEPGQGGSAGFCSTHHPFTAPLRPEDVDLLRTDPLKAKADHYDLVLNGVEIGGGSRRIHVAEVQEYVMRDVLKMTEEGIGQFSHLLEALRAGCPPHAGFAFGFDRLISVLCGASSIRDVIAFPKNNKGEDQLVGSPSKTTLAQQKTYHLFTEPTSEASTA